MGSLTACGRTPPRNDRHYDKVVLISIDTLRADHLGYAGYHRPTSPNIDRLAAQSQDFRHVSSQATSTLPSHASMFTSLYPSVHKADIKRGMPLADSFVTIAEVLRESGFRTAGFVEGGQLDSLWNLDQGFEHYDVTQMSAGETWLPDNLVGILEKAFSWIEAHRAEPLFCFVHSYVVHFPYQPRPPYDTMFDVGYRGTLPKPPTYKEMDPINRSNAQPDPADVEFVASLYDGEIRYMDEHVGAFIDRISRLGIGDRTIVVFTSDHGEELGEHGRLAEHGHTLFDELLHVPLLIHVPDLEARRVDRQVGLIDLAPTLLKLLGVRTDGLPFMGEDILADLDPDRLVLGELDYPRWYWASLRGRDFKLIAQSDTEFHMFDLRNDPGEKHDVFRPGDEIARRRVLELQTLVRRNRSMGPASTAPVEIDPETAAQLRALGYID